MQITMNDREFYGRLALCIVRVDVELARILMRFARIEPDTSRPSTFAKQLTHYRNKGFKSVFPKE